MQAVDLIATARKYLGVKETGPNSGPHIDEWLAALGLTTGFSWCAAFVCGVVMEVDPGTPLNRSASCLHLLALNGGLKITDPESGDIIIHDHGHGLGHAGIVTSTVRLNGTLTGLASIAGNTSPDGLSRNGDGVYEHAVSLNNVAGYLRVCE